MNQEPSRELAVKVQVLSSTVRQLQKQLDALETLAKNPPAIPKNFKILTIDEGLYGIRFVLVMTSAHPMVRRYNGRLQVTCENGYKYELEAENLCETPEEAIAANKINPGKRI